MSQARGTETVRDGVQSATFWPRGETRVMTATTGGLSAGIFVVVDSEPGTSNLRDGSESADSASHRNVIGRWERLCTRTTQTESTATAARFAFFQFASGNLTASGVGDERPTKAKFGISDVTAALRARRRAILCVYCRRRRRRA